MSTIIYFIEGDYTKRMPIDATIGIKVIGAYYIQLKIFTYIRVAGTMMNLKKIPRYPSDRLILLENVRQLIFAYGKVIK